MRVINLYSNLIIQAEQRAAEVEERNRLEREAQRQREHEEQTKMEEIKRKEVRL